MSELYCPISQLKIELEWLKKKSELLHDQKKRLISTWANPAGGLAVTETEIDAAYGFGGHLPKPSIEHIFSGA